MAKATTTQIEAAIAEVAFADSKANLVLLALQSIAIRHPNFDLSFLANEPVEAALAWLKKIPGAGPKVAAATLNFSTLERRAFVMDTHVLRVFRRMGLIGSRTDGQKAYDLTMAALQTWTSAQLSDLHMRVKYLGQTVCRHDVARCRSCPVGGFCDRDLKRRLMA